MRISCFILAVFFAKTLYGQEINKDIYDINGSGGTYAIEFVVKKKVVSAKCNCLMNKEKQCDLYEGMIERIHFFPDKTTMLDRIGLNKVRFFLIGSSFSLNKNEKYLVIVSPGTTSRYLKINRILNLNPDNYKFINSGPYLSGFIKCYKLGFFNRVLLSIGLIRPEQIKYETKSLRKDFFDEYIKTYAIH